MTAGAVLSAEGIVAGYGELEVLHGVSVSVAPGEAVCIIGPNGAGKSTLLRAVFGLIPVRGGRVLLEGADVTNQAPDRLVAAGLAFVPQIQNVFPNLTVVENLEMGGFRKPAGLSDRVARAQDMFPVLRTRAREKAGRLSGGERQMVAIARALVSDPKLLLLDEPTAALAQAVQETVFKTVREIADSGVPVLLVEQNAKKALAACDRGVVLDQGVNRFEGTGLDLLADERVARLYLGKRQEGGPEVAAPEGSAAAEGP
ncbi:MAG TPA: ABC transporter ATP-binding protein [Candidatus Thermoplasmatota archaeon]